MKTMKTNTIILIASMLIAGVLPVAAQTSNWKSSSPMLPNSRQVITWQSCASMQSPGSKFTPRIIAVDAPEVTLKFIPMYSTSTMIETGYVPTPEIDMTPNRKPIRRGFDTGAETGRADEFPIGDPWSMLVFAAAAAGVIAYRRRKAQQAEQITKQTITL